MPEPIQELKAAQDRLGRAFDQFKAANDERLAEIEKRGTASAETDAKVDRINAAVTEAQATLAEMGKTVDDVAAAQARMAIGGRAGKGEESDRLEVNARAFYNSLPAQAEGRTMLPAAFGHDHINLYGEYRKHFPQLLRRGGRDGDKLPVAVQAAMRVGSDPEGGYLVPTEMLEVVQKRIFETSPIRSEATVISISGPEVEFPVDVNDLAATTWADEITSPTETTTPNVGTQKITTHIQQAEPKLTQQLLDDAAIDVEAWLMGKVADKMARTEATAFVTGNGAMRPRGFASYGTNSVTTADASRSWGVLQYVPSGAAGGWPAYSGTAADDPSALIDIIAKMNPAYLPGAIWAMNRLTAASIRKLRDADGRYLVSYELAGAAMGFTLHGFPIRDFEDMANISSDSYSIVFGNFRQAYMIVDRQGMTVLRDPYTAKPFVKFFTTKRVGGDVVNYDALKLIKFSAS
ncbi:MAG: phage major capsid protein [Pseudomonadota bacterium]|nr:phage major capsid protein [Pseudomonadota bacterium]